MQDAQRTRTLRVGLAGALLVLGLALSACGGAQPTPVAESEQSQVSASDTPGSNQDPLTPGARAPAFSMADLPLSTQLVLGTLELEGTAMAVTQEQASQLAFLWKAYRSLTDSGTAAAPELEALVGQIKDAMTAEQLTAIVEMDLTRETMMAWVQENGLGLESDVSGGTQGGASGSRAPAGPGGGAPGAPPEGAPGAGGMMGPGPGAGTGAGAGATGLTPEMQATLQAQRQAEGGGGDRFAQLLLEPLIEMLQSRSAG